MGRKSSLTDKQWIEVGKLLLPPHNKSARSLAKQFNTSEASIRRKFPARRKDVKEVANQIIAAKSGLKSLPIASQIDALNLVDELEAMMRDLSSAGMYSAGTAKMHAKAAHDATSKIMFMAMGDDGETVCPERLKGFADEQMSIMKSTAIANESSKIPLKIAEIRAKEKPENDPEQKIKIIGGMDMFPKPYDHPPRNSSDDL